MATPSSDGCTSSFSSLVSVLPPALTLIAAAATLLLLTCTMTHVLSGSPLSQLGLRPAGRGLWSYLAGQLSPARPTGGIRGTWGYDSSLGSHSPVARVLFHVCAFCVAWAALLLGPAALSAVLAVVHPSASSEQQAEQCSADSDLLTITSPSVLSDGILAAAAYFGGLFLYHMVTPGVSHPGGPREHKIRRMPQWDDITSNADQDVAAKSGVEWRCAVADDSHNVTLERFGVIGSNNNNNHYDGNDDDAGIKLGMTGEPSGRQMWTWSGRKGNAASDGSAGAGTSAGGTLRQLLTPTRGKKKTGAAAVDEDLVQEMACGGRAPGFNPSVNPNR